MNQSIYAQSRRYEGLSFVKQARGKPTDFWNVKETGVWGHDNEIGARCAHELIAYMKQKETPFLGPVIRAMMEKGRYGGIEVGFHQYISESCMRVGHCRPQIPRPCSPAAMRL